MAANIKKAGSILRKSFRSRRIATFEKENINLSDTKATGVEGSGKFRTRTLSESASSCDENGNVSTLANPGTPPLHSQPWLKRGNSMTQSMRDAVGTLRQKIRMSTRRARLHTTNFGSRRHTISGREARLHSPFKAATPTRVGRTHIKTCLSVETPTRLRREVESLTANMQAMNALTPSTLEGKSRTRKTPLTNGSLKTPRQPRKQVTTEIY